MHIGTGGTTSPVPWVEPTVGFSPWEALLRVLLLQGSPCGGHLSGAGLPCIVPFPLFDADVDSVNIGLVASALFQNRARRGDLHLNQSLKTCTIYWGDGQITR